MVRFFMGALIAASLGLARGRPLLVVHRRRAWIRTFFGTLSAFGTFITLSSPRIGLGDSVTLVSTSPLFVALLSSALLGERVDGRVAVALGLSLLGVVAVVRPTFHAAPELAALALGTAVTSALAMISLRRLGPRESGEAIVLHFSLTGAVVFGLLSIPVWKTPDPRSLLAIVLAGAAAGGAQLAMTRAYSLHRAANVAALASFGLVFTRIYAVPVFGERPGIAELGGSLLVVAAGVLVARRPATDVPEEP